MNGYALFNVQSDHSIHDQVTDLVRIIDVGDRQQVNAAQVVRAALQDKGCARELVRDSSLQFVDGPLRPLIQIGKS